MKKKLKFVVRMLPCARCGGTHAHWWSTSATPPPSCAERQARLPCSECYRRISHKMDCSRGRQAET